MGKNAFKPIAITQSPGASKESCITPVGTVGGSCCCCCSIVVVGGSGESRIRIAVGGGTVVDVVIDASVAAGDGAVLVVLGVGPCWHCLEGVCWLGTCSDDL